MILAPYRALFFVARTCRRGGGALVIAAIRATQTSRVGERHGRIRVVLLVVVAAGVVCAAAALVTGARDVGPRFGSRAGRRARARLGMGVLGVGVSPPFSGRAWSTVGSMSCARLPRRPAGSRRAPRAPSSSARAGLWEAALDTHRAEPGHGAGPGDSSSRGTAARVLDFVRDAHSFYLEGLAEDGLAWVWRRGCSSSEVCCRGWRGASCRCSWRSRSQLAS